MAQFEPKNKKEAFSYEPWRNAWTVVLSSIGISEKSQGLFALARLAAPIYCHWRYCVTCCAWVGVLGGK